MGVMVYSLSLWVMQDMYHQPYHGDPTLNPGTSKPSPPPVAAMPSAPKP